MTGYSFILLSLLDYYKIHDCRLAAKEVKGEAPVSHSHTRAVRIDA
jgi:hypothetical protein